ncbi:MAG: DNA mismatch repair protein MutS, partial [Gammaproteobacteria bacterium]|nr:DNA mismatch repair protein MutS [Gammaproteobacteria bacterium]
MNQSSGKKPDPDPDGDLSFSELVGPVTPLKARGRVSMKKRQPPPQPRFREADDRAVLDESISGGPSEPPMSASDEISFRRKGVPVSVLRNLRSGKYAIQEELDLHGMNTTQARTALRQFMSELLMSDTRCVRIIHGKGLRSGP